MIRNDCNVCHTVLDQTYKGQTIQVEQGAFRHPVDLGELGRYNCTVCHSGDKGFQHPINLGDISEFKCTDCHKAK
jgi:hypothetical protein